MHINSAHDMKLNDLLARIHTSNRSRVRIDASVYEGFQRALDVDGQVPEYVGRLANTSDSENGQATFEVYPDQDSSARQVISAEAVAYRILGDDGLHYYRVLGENGKVLELQFIAA